MFFTEFMFEMATLQTCVHLELHIENMTVKGSIGDQWTQYTSNTWRKCYTWISMNKEVASAIWWVNITLLWYRRVNQPGSTPLPYYGVHRPAAHCTEPSADSAQFGFWRGCCQEKSCAYLPKKGNVLDSSYRLVQLGVDKVFGWKDVAVSPVWMVSFSLLSCSMVSSEW